MSYRHEISNQSWERIKEFLAPENKGEGRPSKSNRHMLNGMLWIAKTSAPWRDLPERFGSWQTVYSRFCLWSKNDIFQKVFEHLAADADMQDLSIDSTSACGRCKKGAENAKSKQNIGLLRGGRNTKIHAIVDALGNPVKLHLTPGNINDSAVAVEALSEVTLCSSVVLADKAYGTGDIRGHIELSGASYCIPPKSNTKESWECDFYHYKERHAVECFFNHLKQFRRIATRYDKLSRNF